MSTIMCIYVYIFLFLVSTFIEDIRTVNVLVETHHSWMDAKNNCRDRFGGTLISREAVQNLNIDLSATESFWTLEYGTLSQWNDIIGCFDESSLNTGEDSLILKDNVVGRCSIHCFRNHSFFGVKAGNHCTCFKRLPDSATQKEATNCNNSCEVMGRSAKYLCGGLSHFTVFQKAPKIPTYIPECPYKTTCSCAVSQCEDPEYYGEMCDLSQAASCSRGGFKYASLQAGPVYYSWLNMIDECARGQANAPSSYIDSLLAESDRNTHCNGNAQNPSVIWTSTFRSFVPADKNETDSINGGTFMCSYCTKRDTTFTCAAYYDTCDSTSPQFKLQSICSYEANSSLTSSTYGQTTEGVFTEGNGTATESVTRRPFRKRPRKKRGGSLAMIFGICGGVLAVIVVVIIIVVVVYRRRKKTYDKQTEQMLGSNKNSKNNYSNNTSPGHGNSNQGESTDDTRNTSNAEENMDLNGTKDNSLSNRHVLPGYMYGSSSKASPNKIYVPSENMYDHTNTTNNKASLKQKMEGLGKGDETYDHTNVQPYPSSNSDYYDHMGVHADTESMYGVSNDKARNDMSLREGDIYNHTSERDIHGGDMEPSVYYDHGMRSTENSEYDHLQHKKGNGETSRPRDEAENIYDESNL